MPSIHYLFHTALAVITAPLELILVHLYYLRKANRPNAAWSLKTTVGVHIIYMVFRWSEKVKFRTPKSLEPGPEGKNFIVIDPKEHEDLFTGTLSIDPAIRPLPVGAVWYNDVPPPNQPLDRLVIHFHPGAYILCGPRPSEQMGWGPTNFTKASGWPMLAVQYRLSLEENTRFPAALQDAFTTYFYAVKTLGVPPENIVLSGESAGGNLVLAMLRFLATENPDNALPLPRAALLWHPWINMTKEGTDAVDKNHNYKSDYVFSALVEWGASAYIPPTWSRNDPYFTAIGNETKLPVPVYFQTATAEVQYDDHIKYIEKMKTTGTDLEFHEVPNAAHAMFGTGEAQAMEDASREGHARAIKFMNKYERK